MRKLNNDEITRYYNKEVKGFYIWLGGKDHFIITDRKNITNKFIIDFLGGTPSDIKQYKYKMTPAYMTVKMLCNKYDVNIYNDSFGGYGGFLEDNNTIVYIEN